MTSDRIARLHIQLDEVEPAIWRRVEVPLTSSFKAIHDAIQAAMLFEDCHLFQFEIGNRRYGYPDPDWGNDMRDARYIRLSSVVDRNVTRFTYTYDFGDDWRHSVVVEDVFAAEPIVDSPRFVDGARRAPPEDVGGLPGFEAFLEAMADPEHPEHHSVRTWYGRRFEPEDIDVRTITQRFAKLARRRAAGRAGYEKSRNRIN